MSTIETLSHDPVFAPIGAEVTLVPGVASVMPEIPQSVKMVYLKLTNPRSVGRGYGMWGGDRLAEYAYCSVIQGVSVVVPPIVVTHAHTLIYMPEWYGFPFNLLVDSRCFAIAQCYDVGVRKKVWNILDPQNLPPVLAQYVLNI